MQQRKNDTGIATELQLVFVTRRGPVFSWYGPTRRSAMNSFQVVVWLHLGAGAIPWQGTLLGPIEVLGKRGWWPVWLRKPVSSQNWIRTVNTLR
jgi:hypothetical protein